MPDSFTKAFDEHEEQQRQLRAYRAFQGTLSARPTNKPGSSSSHANNPPSRPASRGIFANKPPSPPPPQAPP